jgi:predicted lipoprotein with Yx(FWY)xxD motif
MNKLVSAALAAGASLLIAACGGGGDQSSAAGGSSSGAGGATVSVKKIGDVGDALVSRDTMTLYTSNVEATGKIRCTGDCTSFWKPLHPSGTTPTANGDAGKLGVIKRPDGSQQVTANGLPLYTFAEDGPGEVKGEGFTDDFDGQHFIWHAVVAGGKPASAAASGGSGGDSSGGAYSGGGY